MYKLPKLPYKFNALQPYIDEKTMEIHHGKHHQGYVNKLNKALEGNEDLLDKPIEDLLTNLDQLPDEIKTNVQNNGGGHYNHSLYWNILSPKGGGKPKGDLLNLIEKFFSSYENFVDEFEIAALGRFGSGWAWLCYKSGKLQVCSTKNQINPLMHDHFPLMGLDVWEHAYYLKYQNRRADYVKAFWNLVNWAEVSDRLKKIS